jgi:hypothetical protein
MEMSKLQTIALVVLTTIFTDKYIIDHKQPTLVQNPVVQSTTLSPSPTPQISQPIVPTTPPSNTQNELILKELQNLRKDMNTTLNNVGTKTTNQDPLPTLNPSLIGGMVKINSAQWKRIDVYERSSTSSKVINTISYDVIYFYSQKIDGWYQLNLDGGQNGWVQSQFLKEYP